MSSSRTETQVRRRTFVVGVPRSGTTLVQSLLAAHSTTTSFTESHFFDRHFTLLPLLSRPLLTRNPRPRLREFLAENGETAPEAAAWFEGKGRRALSWRPLLPLSTRPVAHRFLRVLDELTLRRGATSWIEKTPRHLRYLSFLESLGDSGAPIHFVHVVRDGLEVVASLHQASKAWPHSYDLESCVRRWNADVGFSLSRVGAPKDHFVFYEQLTSQPETTLRRLVAALGLDWESQILELYSSTSERLVTPQEASWKLDVGRSIHRSATSDTVLTHEQRKRVASSLRQELYEQLFERAGVRWRETDGGR